MINVGVSTLEPPDMEDRVPFAVPWCLTLVQETTTKSSSTSIGATFVPCLICTRNSLGSEITMSSDEEAQLGVKVGAWLGMNDVDPLNFNSTTLKKDHIQEKIR